MRPDPAQIRHISLENPATVRWLAETCAKASWITSVCTGSFLLVGCGIARGRNVVSAAGVMSGIEMPLWLVGELYGGEVAGRTKSYIAYDFPLRRTSEGIIR
jgi:transcriptional regulator GlxA family with amidase domain